MILLIKLNLGCGKIKKEEYINCDINPEVFPDNILDLTKKLPFEDNVADEVYASHVLEHINQEILIAVTLPEIWRICKNKAKIIIIVPYLDAQLTLDHKTRFNEDTFKNWCKETYNSSESYPFIFSFNLISVKYGRSRCWGWIHRMIPLRSWRMLHSHLVNEIKVTMEVVK